MARAIASGGSANLSRAFSSWRFHLWICHGFCEVRVHEPRRNDRHAQFLAGLHAQALGDRAHGELRGGIDRLVRHRLMSGGRSGVDEMSETLLAKDRQRGGDSVKNTFDVDVDHVFPILNAQVVQGRHRHDAGIVDRERRAGRSGRARGLTRLVRSSRRLTSVWA